ncbi:hypothetical protein BH23PSE1_BH23PSE1_05010 [soil metagenome]
MVDERPLKAGSARRAPVKDRSPLIIYASETGTAEIYARQASRFIGSLSPRVMGMDDALRAGLKGETAVFVVSSTHRDGEVPTNGQAMMAWLKEQEPGALEGIRFAVLGIGNRIYSDFCAAAHAFDAAFASTGAQRAIALTLADEIAGQADSVKQWIEMIAHLLGATPQRPADTRRPRVEITSPGRVTAHHPGASATVLGNEEMLVAPAGGRSTRTLLLALDPAEDGQAPSYRPGDHLAIMPVNPADQVARLCEHLGLQQSSWFKLSRSTNPAFDPFTAPFPFDRQLGEELDLSLPDAPEELLGALREAAADPSDREILDKWIGLLDLEKTNPARQRHKQWLRSSFPTLPDLLDAFPEACPPLDVLIDILPRLRPRMYSIASSPLAAPSAVRIMAGLLHYPAADGSLRKGIASQYLAMLAPGARVRAAIKSSPRQLPPDYEGPLLLVGAGTGLSQLFGILEDRAARGIASRKGSRTRLYFGCREGGEFLMRDQLLAWRAAGHLDAVTVAYSRKTPVKAYVQDALDAEAEQVLELLNEPGARVMVCGDARMAQEVADRLLQIFQRDGGLSYLAATQRLREMRETERYLEDVWGIHLNREVALAEVVREKYDQGAGWLSRLSRVFGARRSEMEAVRRY